jgi:hypothetical protein
MAAVTALPRRWVVRPADTQLLMRVIDKRRQGPSAV